MAGVSAGRTTEVSEMHYLTSTYLTSYLLGPYKLCRLWACTCAALVISTLCSLLSAPVSG